MIFGLAGRRMALPAALVREALPVPRLDRRPGTPPALAGFFSLGGVTVPVLDLAVLLGLRDFGEAPELDPLYRPILRLDSLSLLVDRLEQVRVPEGADAEAGEDPWQNRCVARHLRADGPVSLLDPDRLLLEEERARLDLLTADAERRTRLWGADGGDVVD
ncbi:chemotaxis protein CheW [Acetobacteraceae bacterium KSS8]|uniref:Chemotaxis protein CheW n=1 Tax=Endosaccharibacter trunci TaxID=2812733 RepID=A0ABT1W781_9PROT|nr:chemotaxis protein CheW [Acetobacteraceae bacterium KSS8]